MKTVIFDLDGTLIDSFPGIEQSFRHAAAIVVPDREFPDVRSLIGPPVAKMFAQAWPDLPAENHEQLVAAFRAHYNIQGCLASTLYPDVYEIAHQLNEAGTRLFVLTNKPQEPANRILRKLGLHHLFTEVISPDSTTPPWFTKPDGARFLIEKFQLDTDAAIVVGDGHDDFLAAEACHIRFVAAAYGYGTAAVHSPTQIKKFSEIVGHLL